jgi:hypothetical protein
MDKYYILFLQPALTHGAGVMAAVTRVHHNPADFRNERLLFLLFNRSFCLQFIMQLPGELTEQRQSLQPDRRDWSQDGLSRCPLITSYVNYQP